MGNQEAIKYIELSTLTPVQHDRLIKYARDLELMHEARNKALNSLPDLNPLTRLREQKEMEQMLKDSRFYDGIYKDLSSWNGSILVVTPRIDSPIYDPCVGSNRMDLKAFRTLIVVLYGDMVTDTLSPKGSGYFWEADNSFKGTTRSYIQVELTLAKP